MRVYSDSKISDFLASMQRDSAVKFLNAWNASQGTIKKKIIFLMTQQIRTVRLERLRLRSLAMQKMIKASQS